MSPSGLAQGHGGCTEVEELEVPAYLTTGQNCHKQNTYKSTSRIIKTMLQIPKDKVEQQEKWVSNEQYFYLDKNKHFILEEIESASQKRKEH